MAYTAIEKMRKQNKARFNTDVGPFQPHLYINQRMKNDLKSASLRFLHNRCEELRFDAARTEEENANGVYLGKSLKSGQIPYNMEMDVNRLCLEKALEVFIDSGVAEDAYSVYYCFMQIFLGQYGKSKKMVELLSEYETNGSSLLMKHRDHYSHSVYVFVLGLAIYETNITYRNTFCSFYHLEGRRENEISNLFLEYWGLTSLFHDIGYSFELPFEQVLSYFEAGGGSRGDGSAYIAYNNIEALTLIDEGANDHFKAVYGRDFKTTSELLAFDITQKLGGIYNFDEKYLLDVINKKPTEPNRFGYFMDHAFFSAVRLYHEFVDIFGSQNLTTMHIDTLSAIMLHNSLYKFSVAFYKDKEKHKEPLKVAAHPLAWLLMLCDELQCWDRIAYGRNSRTEIHPISASFDFSANALAATYIYNDSEKEKIEKFTNEYAKWEHDPEGVKKPYLKAYGDMIGEKSDFVIDIEKIVDTTDIPLSITTKLCPVKRKNKHTYLSGSNFLHFYDFAVALHARNMLGNPSPQQMEEKFLSGSLEYQLSTMGRTRHFAEYLNAINCFYTDKPVDFELITQFTAKDASLFAPMEHERWIREHRAMGWRYGVEYETLPLNVPEKEEKEARSSLREQLRCHKLCMDGKPSSNEIRLHYQRLPRNYQDLDWKPFNRLLELLKKFEGTQIYKL